MPLKEDCKKNIFMLKKNQVQPLSLKLFNYLIMTETAMHHVRDHHVMFQGIKTYNIYFRPTGVIVNNNNVSQVKSPLFI